MVDLVKARQKAKREKENAASPEERERLEKSPAPEKKIPSPITEEIPRDASGDAVLAVEPPPEKGAAATPPLPAAPAKTASDAAPKEKPSDAEEAPAPSASEKSLQRCLACLAGNEVYGIPIETIDEIIPIHSVTVVPNVPTVLAGIMSLRGQIVTVIDARRRLGHEAKAFTEESRIVVLRHEGELFGLEWDAVHQVVDVPEGSLEPISSMTSTPGESPCLRGVYHRPKSAADAHGEMLIILDLAKFLTILL